MPDGALRRLLELVHDAGLRARLTALVQREALLREVGQIARTMTSTQDIGTVMADVLARTRRLTGADMAYISLNSGTETFIRYHDGIRTEGYRTIRMPLGTGVLGRAATGAEPVYTRDYLHDPQLLHLPDIDRRVRAERVRSILGMPMTLHGVVHGALLIADRQPTDYGADVLDTMETLALHTAVALEYAGRLDEVTEALDRLATRRDLEYERVVDLHEVLNLEGRLLEAILRRTSPGELTRSVQELLGAPVRILDAQDPAPADLEPAIRTARHTARPVVQGETTVTCALGAGEHLATVLVDAVVPESLHLRLQRVATFLGLAVLMGRAQRDEVDRRDREVINALVGSGPRSVAARETITALRIGPTRPYRLVSLTARDDASGGGSDVLVHRVRSALALPSTVGPGAVGPGAVGPGVGGTGAVGPSAVGTGAVGPGVGGTGHPLGSSSIAGMIIARHGDHVCVLLPEEAWRERGECALTRIIADGAAPSGGVSSPLTTAGDGARAHREAEQARGTLELLGVTGRLASGEHLGAVGLLSEALQHLPRSESPLGQVDSLRAYDAAHGGELTRTAWVFAESGGSVRESARQLHVHQNTVRQRLSRIGALLGEDWREPARFLDIHIALRMWALAHG